jgi:diguanylate cyclase (GGDEF)-like protein
MAKKYLLIGGLIVGSALGLYFFSRVNYLFFHTTLEFATIAAGLLIFIISWISRKYNQQSFFLAIGPGFLVVSLITFLHTITFRGTGIIDGYDTNLPTQLWVILSFTLVLTFLFAIMHAKRDTRYNLVMISNVGFGLLATLVSFARLFPDCYIDGVGLTPFKIISEYVIILLYVMCVLLLVAQKSQFSSRLYRGLLLILALLISSGFMFTLYQNVYGITNFLGHFLRLVAFVILFQFVVVEGITKPYDTVFAELRELSNKDGLTNLYNHRSLLGFLMEFQKMSFKNDFQAYLIIFDIDYFKNINDSYGHQVGDEVLKAIANVLAKTIRPSDIAVRQGGDEFSVVFTNVEDQQARIIVEDIRQALVNNALTDHKINITVSGGVVKYGGEDVNTFLKRADQLLYDAKQNGKDQFIIDF